MGKGKIEPTVTFKSVPHAKRFWLTSEQCYTEAELDFRQWLLKARALSGISPDYLITANSWFADDAQALVNINEHSWVYPDAFKPRQTLSRDDFHVQPVEGQRLQWPVLYELMQKTGDYLILRNQELPNEHLNQPMNYILLDVISIVRHLSQNTNIHQVKDQLELLNRYLRTIEKHEAAQGYDRLFLANFRAVIDHQVHPYLIEKIESQLLRDRLDLLSKTIGSLSTARNRILHFALNINPVNHHSFDFVSTRMLDVKTYPTQAARECSHLDTELVSDPLALLKLSVEQLKDCPHFELISMNDEILDHYANAISDLNELHRFQNIIQHTMELLGQAGQVYTIYQFSEEMIGLLRKIDLFIDQSAKHIDAILEANTRAYHRAIQQEQDLSYWQKWLTSEREKLKNFIKNQDTLAQFPSTATDVAKMNKESKEHVNQVLTHLSHSALTRTSFEAIADKSQELDALIGSMRSWIDVKAITPQPMSQVWVRPPIQPSNQFFSPQVPLISPSSNSVATLNLSSMLLLFPLSLLVWYVLVEGIRSFSSRDEEPGIPEPGCKQPGYN